jgi:DNA-binding CsgD family transcriptional regulator
VAEHIAEIEQARAAAKQGSWRASYELLRTRDPVELGPDDLEVLADAAWWLSRVDESIAARQQAYAGYAAAGDATRAATIAARLSIDHFVRGETAIGAGWLRKAQRHAADVDEGPGHGLLLLVEATVARFSGDLEGAMALTDRAAELGQRFRDPDLMAMAIHTRGLLLIALGDVIEGVSLLDEAMTSVVAGQLSPYFTGIVYCNVIGACLELADVRRAGQWSEAARTWCESLPSESPFPGMCRINRAEVARLRGAWSEAEAEATRASEELMSFDPMAAAQALHETGEIRRRMGDLAGAEACFARAREIGHDPQPGLALLRLAQGRVEAATTSIDHALAPVSDGRLQRARLLAAQVEIGLAASDDATADAAAVELAELAEPGTTAVLEAMALTARGAVDAARGESSRAVDALRRACTMWHGLRLPYERARARALYGLALRAAGDDDDAASELRAALSTFEELGAAPDAAAVARHLERPGTLPAGLTAREAEVLRLVAAGKSNREIATALVISEHTVARHMQNMFVKLRVSSRSAATAFAFEHDLA